jgi:hypothetical protein
MWQVATVRGLIYTEPKLERACPSEEKRFVPAGRHRGKILPFGRIMESETIGGVFMAISHEKVSHFFARFLLMPVLFVLAGSYPVTAFWQTTVIAA